MFEGEKFTAKITDDCIWNNPNCLGNITIHHKKLNTNDNNV